MTNAKNYDEAIKNYQRMLDIVKAAQLLRDNHYDIDNSWECVEEEWQITCEDMLECLMDANSDVLHRLKGIISLFFILFLLSITCQNRPGRNIVKKLSIKFANNT